MPTYMIARTTITDRAKFENEFMPTIRPAFEAHGARLLAQSDDVVTVIGNDAIAHAAILEFPDLAAARACAASSDFQAAMAIAATCMTDHMVRMINGLQAPAEIAAAKKEPAE